MKYLCVSLILLLFGLPVVAQNDLYPISQNNRWGFIDRAGKIIIKPQFHEVREFSEGLAAVRIHGHFGYIDTTGKVVIPPLFESVSSFKNGIAHSYVKGKPHIINKEGKILFDHPYHQIGFFDSRKIATVSTKDKKLGVINLKGELIIDTLYSEVEEAGDGLFIVKKKAQLENTGPYSTEDTYTAIIDTNGRYLVKPGRYEVITPFRNGYSLVIGIYHDEYPDHPDSLARYEYGYLNLQGELALPFGRHCDLSWFNNGYARVRRIENKNGEVIKTDQIIDSSLNTCYSIPEWEWDLFQIYDEIDPSITLIVISNNKEDSKYFRRGYIGGINTKGEIVWSNKEWIDVKPFVHNRSFVQDKKNNWYMINYQGKKINAEAYLEVYPTDPYSPTFFVRNNTGIFQVDTNGFVLSGPIDRHYDIVKRCKNIVAISEIRSYDKRQGPTIRYGFWNVSNGVLVKPKYDYLIFEKANGNLIEAHLKNETCYLNFDGHIVWKSGKPPRKKNPLNIDYMQSCSYSARSSFIPNLNSIRGWAEFGTTSKPMRKKKEKKYSSVSIHIDTSKTITYENYIEGLKVFVYNASKDSIYIEAQDSRIRMFVQAIDKNGEWKDIEKMPWSGCGNSYHKVYLENSAYWEFAMPVFEGEDKTKLRIRLEYRTSIDQQEASVAYSNVIEGSVNPGQFWKYSDEFPMWIMQPSGD